MLSRAAPPLICYRDDRTWGFHHLGSLHPQNTTKWLGLWSTPGRFQLVMPWTRYILASSNKDSRKPVLMNKPMIPMTLPFSRETAMASIPSTPAKASPRSRRGFFLAMEGTLKQPIPTPPPRGQGKANRFRYIHVRCDWPVAAADDGHLPVSKTFCDGATTRGGRTAVGYDKAMAGQVFLSWSQTRLGYNPHHDQKYLLIRWWFAPRRRPRLPLFMGHGFWSEPSPVFGHFTSTNRRDPAATPQLLVLGGLKRHPGRSAFASHGPTLHRADAVRDGGRRRAAERVLVLIRYLIGWVSAEVGLDAQSRYTMGAAYGGCEDGMMDAPKPWAEERDSSGCSDGKDATAADSDNARWN
ncbi:hypothetical protein CCM_08239 [Cordyceps militaris CM01]|uniref:Uncharacterized protein n=1 Tax=Cordyceps militaris (strain CM01) TaxID=983644 RepID=G3JNG6_CORMM|nr:uncharacterized protein CCM_08239 [Cordyceps militaris CM01]EGX89985.1 hypothetical protein CCM_08239 [Cordyceps militaris CM01]